VSVTMTPAIHRQERFASVGSTNDVVRGWLAAGEPEICMAVADEQTAGRGRNGRTWTAPPGAGLLLSLGFRPTWLAPDQAWRLAATVSIAMAEAAEAVAGLPAGTIRLKWPNDLVAIDDGVVNKLAGVLGETDGLGTDGPLAVVGIGLNTNWAEADFPPELRSSMTSLRAMRGDRDVDDASILAAFVERLERGTLDLHDGRFAVGSWVDRQVTTGRTIELVDHAGSTREHVAVGVDAETGALRIADSAAEANERPIFVGDIRHVRLAGV